MLSPTFPMVSASDIRTLIENYRTDQSTPLDMHVKRRALELGVEVQPKIKIYLDLRFWLILREVLLNRSSSPEAEELLALLKVAVKEGKAICPISESVFLELLKQNDRETRQATAEVVDSLSGGVTLVHANQRVAQEIVGVFTKFSDAVKYHAPHELVWSKLSYTLGFFHPTIPDLPAEQQLPFQKAFFDTLWEMSLVGLLDHAKGPIHYLGQDYEDLAQRINHLNQEHATSLKSYRQAYLDEFRGMLGSHIHVARSYIEDSFQRQSGQNYTPSQEEQQEEENRLLTFFGNLIEKNSGAVLLPTLHISSICYAAVRWDKQRRLTGNDLFDFQHAQAALAYCNAFLTEGPLNALLLQRRKEWESDFPCKVMSDVLEAKNWVASAVGR